MPGQSPATPARRSALARIRHVGSGSSWSSWPHLPVVPRCLAATIDTSTRCPADGGVIGPASTGPWALHLPPSGGIARNQDAPGRGGMGLSRSRNTAQPPVLSAVIAVEGVAFAALLGLDGSVVWRV